MKQGGGQTTPGFTIVETLIVLAVTAALFLSVAFLINGRQSKTEFQQAINEVVTQIQQTANEVSTGYYPDINNISCTGTGSLSFSHGNPNQGTNKGCIFIGKIMQFGISGGPGTNEQYATYTLAGCQYDSCDATHDVATSPTGAEVKVALSANQKTDLLNGLTTKWMKYNSGASVAGAVGFLQTLGTSSPVNCSGLCSGSQQVQLWVVVSGSPLGQINPNAISHSDIVQANDVTICFQSGSTNQSGLVTIGGNGRQTSVTLDIKDTTDCS